MTGDRATRVVLLGASNLTLGLPTVLRTTRAVVGPGALEVAVAAGHGRSYGQWSRVFFRGLPGILDCGLWAALAPGGMRTHALVTDVGNDLAYGVAPAVLAGWVEACIDRLRRLDADIVLTLLPAGSLLRLRPWQYQLFKSVLFPGRRLPFRALQERVAEVNARLGDIAAAGVVKLVEPETPWYRPDAIHIRRSRHPVAWERILSRWTPPAGVASLAPTAGPRVSCRGLAPEHWTLCGLTRRRAQPCGVLPDGTVVSLF